MKKITLTEMHLVNFKGIVSRDLVFNGNETTIVGANHSGKTSTFDAFVWLLFGKDSKGRKDYGIKTYDADGNVINRIPHEVSAVLDVDGIKVSLRRVYSEIWSKDTLKGHVTEVFIDDVPMKLTEYNERINQICKEETFHMITDPFAFTSLHWEKQRDALYKMAGEFTNEDVAADTYEFEEVLEMLTNKSVEDLSKEIANKKRRVKDEMERGIPTRRDEVSRGLVEEQDWAGLQEHADAISAELESLSSKVQAAYAEATKQNEERMRIYNDINDARRELAERQSQIVNDVTSGYYERRRKYEEIVRTLRSLEFNRDEIASYMTILEKRKEDYSKMRECLINDYRRISAMEFDTSSVNLVCPTCGQKLDEETAENRIAAMSLKFNAEKARQLSENKESGLSVRKKLEDVIAELQSKNEELENIIGQISAIGTPSFTEAMPDTHTAVEADDTIKMLRTKIADLEASVKSVAQSSSDNDLSALRAEKQRELDTIKSMLSKKETRDSQLRRISELDEELKTLAIELSRLERIEYKVLQFNKARASFIENRINSLFRIVRFKLFDTQINGNTIPCCEATCDGVPFSNRSTSEQTNMGLDIINAICTRYEVYAPIFIDNRECITEILPMDSQIINLRVDDNYKSLTIL